MDGHGPKRPGLGIDHNSAVKRPRLKATSNNEMDTNEDIDDVLEIATQLEDEYYQRHREPSDQQISYVDFRMPRMPSSTQFSLPVNGHALQPNSNRSNTQQDKENTNMDPVVLMQRYLTQQNRSQALERQILKMRAKIKQLEPYVALSEQLQPYKKRFEQLTNSKNDELLLTKFPNNQPRSNVEAMNEEQLEKLREIERENEDLKKKLCAQKTEKARLPSQSSTTSSTDEDNDDNNIDFGARYAFIGNITEKDLFSPGMPKIAIDKPKDDIKRLHFLLNEFISFPTDEKESQEICNKIFCEIVPIVVKMCEMIEIEESKNVVYGFTKTECLKRNSDLIKYQFREIIEMQETPAHFFQERLTSEGDLNKEVLQFMKKDPNSSDEKLFKKRIIIGMLAAFADHSCAMSQLMVSFNVSQIIQVRGGAEKKILDLISDRVTESIIPTRKYTEYSGFAEALAHLASNISRHYSKLKGGKFIDNTLSDFFNSVILLSQNNLAVVLKLSKFIINIAKVEDYNRLLAKLCSNFPTCKYSYRHVSLVQIQPCACELQTFFLLLLHTFPNNDEVPQHHINALFELSENLNSAVYHVLTHGTHLKFMQSIFDFETSNSCKCLYGIINSLVFLNKKIIQHRSDLSQRYNNRIMISLQCFLCFASMVMPTVSNTVPYAEMKNLHLAINEIHLMMKECGQTTEKKYKKKDIPYIPDISNTLLPLENIFDPKCLESCNSLSSPAADADIVDITLCDELETKSLMFI